MKERGRKDKEALDKINDEIFRKQISLEYLWRNVMHYLSDVDTKVTAYNQDKQNLVSKVEQLMRNGEAFELIDGENLEFKGNFIKEIIGKAEKDKVIVVAVIGPQSSGKSTLMNYSFGT